MGFKQNPWPVILGIVLLGGVGIGILLINAVPTDEEIRDKVLRHARAKLSAEGKEEGKDFTIGKVEILILNENFAVVDVEVRPQGRPLYYHVSNLEGRWVVTNELHESFQEFCRQPENERAIISRLGKRITRRFGPNINWTIKAGLRVNYYVRRIKDTVAGEIEVRFAYPKTPRGQKSGRYMEMFFFKEGHWQSQGVGQLFDVGPPPKRRPPKRP